MQVVLVAQSFYPELEHTSDTILQHVAALHALGVEIVVSVGGKGRVLADTLEDKNVPYAITYSDISVEASGATKHTNPLGQSEGRCIR